jgi:hypothetical protein
MALVRQDSYMFVDAIINLSYFISSDNNPHLNVKNDIGDNNC